MNDLDSRIAEEIDDEALCRLAEGEEREFSPEYQQSMERLFRKSRAHPKRRMKPIRRIVAIAAIITMLTGAAAAATFWETIQQFFVTTFGQYAELRAEPAVDPTKEMLELVPNEWEKFWYPNERCGYVIEDAKTIGRQKLIVFLHGSEELKLYQCQSNKFINVDTEAETVQGIFVGDEEVYATEKVVENITYRTIFFIKEDISFILRGTLEFSDLSKIANSLVLIEK